MKLKQSLYYAKILLFGEYGIIEDSMGLSIPFNKFNGALKTDGRQDEFALNSNKDIRLFAEYLKNLDQNGEMVCHFDFERLEADLNHGLYFDSSIPQGFGVGSSGALVASIYDAYCTDKVEIKANQTGDEILVLKNTFSKLESYFHGKSSGLDPLICYLNLPVLIKSKTHLDTVGLPMPDESGKGAIFLMDSGIPGQTQNMVSIFLEKCKQDGFRNLVRHQFKKYNDECIHAFLNRDFKPLFKSLKQLSQLVYDNFSPMIPDQFKTLWKEGIDSNSYYLKLCGSGGGGFILGFTEDFEQALEKLKHHQLQVIYKF
ncbi:MAG: mevalonate kinase [Bacteroidetes bacterium]|nr:mevalonate kinase [Bacteroidota bacterium]